jgi:hypothetical protein
MHIILNTDIYSFLVSYGFLQQEVTMFETAYKKKNYVRDTVE